MAASSKERYSQINAHFTKIAGANIEMSPKKSKSSLLDVTKKTQVTI